MSIHAMTIADSKQVETQVVHDVGHQDVAVLVWLVRVAWLVTDARGESKLCDAVELLRGLYRRYY